MLTALEIRAAQAAFIASISVLAVTFIAGGIYWQHNGRRAETGNRSATSEILAAKGHSLFLRSCSQCHGQDADGGEDAPSLLKLQISGAHMALVIQSGIKDEMPSFAKKYNQEETAALVAYLKTLK